MKRQVVKPTRYNYVCTCGNKTDLSCNIHKHIQDKSRSYVFAKCHHQITPEQYQK